MEPSPTGGVIITEQDLLRCMDSYYVTLGHKDKCGNYWFSDVPGVWYARINGERVERDKPDD